MPKVPELNWSKLKPNTPETIRRKKVAKVAKVHKPKKIRHRKKKKAKIIDKRLFGDIYDQNQHLRNI